MLVANLGYIYFRRTRLRRSSLEEPGKICAVIRRSGPIFDSKYYANWPYILLGMNG